MEEENYKAFPNLRQNLYKYLLQLTLQEKPYNAWKNKNLTHKPCSLQYLKNILEKTESDKENAGILLFNIDTLIPFFVEESLENFLDIHTSFANYYLHLLVHDFQNGLNLNMLSQSISIYKIEQFLLTALTKYKNSTDGTVNCMKISYYCKNRQELYLNFVKEKYELNFENKLKQVINSILQYSESSSGKQTEEMLKKIQLFIITNYQLGYPSDDLLVRQCRQSINSILGKGDIQKHVLRKKCHRLEYLKKLSATAAGILIFKKQGIEANIENVRNLFADLKMSQCNTKESILEGFDRVQYLMQIASKTLPKLFEINIQERNIYFLRPLAEIRELNEFIVLFEVYSKNLEKIKQIFEKTEYLIEVDKKKFDSVIAKIDNILKYRCAIETEKIFPHFVYLSEIWNTLILYINHLLEINKTKHHLDDLLSKKLENKLDETIRHLNDKNGYLKDPIKISFQEIINSTTKRNRKFNMFNIKPFIKEYCVFTMALTGGFLISSQLEKKLYENLNFCFGFSKIEYTTFFENHLEDFFQVFCATILGNTNLIVLFELEEEVMQQEFKLTQPTQIETKSSDTQTDMISNEKKTKNRIDETWNVWSFHRQTIKLANIRKKQTQSTQSNLSFGVRNSQTQCENTTNNKTQK